MQKEVKDILSKLVKGYLQFDEPMRYHTSLNVGGPADALVVPKDASDVVDVISLASESGTRVTIIGNGSNLVVHDEGIDGIVVKVAGCLNNIIVQQKRITVGAGHWYYEN